MILNAQGQPVSSSSVRNGNQVDAFQLPDGTIISAKAAKIMIEKARNDTVFRERLERADKEQYEFRLRRWWQNGCPGHAPRKEENWILAFLRRDNNEFTAEIQDKLIKNQEFGEKIMRQRTQNEGLKESEKGYEKLSAS